MAVSDIEAAIFECLDDPDGVAAFIAKGEKKRGYKVVPVGSVEWLPETEWDHDSVVSLDEKNTAVRLVLIVARHKRRGSFKRLVSAIIAAGMKPYVIEPTFEMADIMRKWGWKSRSKGATFSTRENWFEPA